ncbi:hypothetical protein [Facklamia sp. P12955]
MVTQKCKQSAKGKTFIYFWDVYSAVTGQTAYDHLHDETGRQAKWITNKDFIDWVDEKILHKGWSPDAVVVTLSVMNYSVKSRFHARKRSITGSIWGSS